MQEKSKYGEIKFFLVFIAFVSAFNYYLTYSNIRINWFLVITYLIDTVQGWLAWWALRSIIIYLDRKMPYGQKPLKRIIVQIVLTTITGLLIIVLLTELVSFIAKGRSAPLNFYTFDVLIFVIWFLVLNGIYVGMHYYNEWNLSELNRQEDKKIKMTGFYVKQGRQDLQIPFAEIRGFYSESGFTYLQTIHDKTFVIDGSLDKAEQLIPGELFFRLNRKYMLHRNVVSGFKRVSDGKLEVQINSFGNMPPEVAVSRIRAADFKKWFQLEEN
jgi:DNA-binding LytR/AlgR family response regulator